MFNGLKIAAFVMLAVIGSIYLADYLDGRRVSLPSIFADNISLFEWDEPISEPVLPANDIDVSNKHQPENGEIEHPESPLFYGCKDLSLGEVEPNAVSGIYTWTDKQGIDHFSDIQPGNDEFLVYDFAGELVLDYFDLNLMGINVPADFKDQLRGKINKLFSFYGQILDKNSLSKTEVNLRFFGSKKEFDRFQTISAAKLTTGVAGFYTDSNNEAAIMFSDATSAMNTALHETSHAINRNIIGYSNRWLNEGLAEYLERIEIVLQSGSIEPNTDWYTNNKFRLQPLPLNRVFRATDDDWNGNLRLRLYATSWAFIYFLLDSEQGKASLTRLVNLEQKKTCNSLSLAQIQQALNTDVNSLQARFTSWLGDGQLGVHRL